MQPVITEKRPNTKPAVSKKRRDTMPTSRTATIYMRCTMRKRRQKITPQNTALSSAWGDVEGRHSALYLVHHFIGKLAGQM